jgi:hypothetical protein
MAAVPPPASRAVPGSLAGRFGNSQYATSGAVDPALLGYDASGQPLLTAPQQSAPIASAPVVGAPIGTQPIAPQYPAGIAPPPLTGAAPDLAPPPGPVMAAVPPPAARAAPGSLAGRFGNSQYATSGAVDPALLGYDASGQPTQPVASAPAAPAVVTPQYPPGVTPPPGAVPLMPPGPAAAPVPGPAMAALPPPAQALPSGRAAPGSLAGRFGNSRYATSGPVDPALLGYDASGQPLPADQSGPVASGPVAPQYPSGVTPPPGAVPLMAQPGLTPGPAVAALPPPAARAAPGSLAGRFGNSQYATSGPVDPALLGYDASGQPLPAGQSGAVAPQYPAGVTPPPLPGGADLAPPAPLPGPAIAAVPPPTARGAARTRGGRTSQYAVSGPVDPAALSAGGLSYDQNGQRRRPIRRVSRRRRR